jgi:hypothetical protein
MSNGEAVQFDAVTGILEAHEPLFLFAVGYGSKELTKAFGSLVVSRIPSHRKNGRLPGPDPFADRTSGVCYLQLGRIVLVASVDAITNSVIYVAK